MAYHIDEINAAVEAVERLGSQRIAAKELGISRRSLQRRVAEFKRHDTFLEGQAEAVGFDAEKVNHYWIKTNNGSFHVRKDTNIDYNELRNNFLEEAAEYAPRYYSQRQGHGTNEEHLLVMDIADAHFGKLALSEETGQEYNLEIAEQRMREGVYALTQKAIVHGIDRIVFVIGNDILHIDSPFRKTTAGTPQDTDSQWWKAFQVAKRCYVACIEELARIAPVHLVFNPSNHDYASGFMLADSVSSWFHNHPDVVTDDASMSIAHRKYVQYGANLIGFTHGDGAKEVNLPSIMQFEARKNWGNTKYGYWYTHHYHVKDRKVFGKAKHQMEKDHTGITVIETGKGIDPESSIFVEVVRSPSSADGWHHRNGYLGSVSVECFLHHVDRGQVARFTHHF